jgi:hypothetical protein
MVLITINVVPALFGFALATAVAFVALVVVVSDGFSDTPPDFLATFFVIAMIFGALGFSLYYIAEPYLHAIPQALYRPFRQPLTPPGIEAALRDLADQAQADGLLSQSEDLNRFADTFVVMNISAN